MDITLQQTWATADWDALKKQYHDLLISDHFVGIDIETTGFSPNKFSQIIELSAIRLDNPDSEEFTKLETLVRPVGKIPPKISKITGITDEMVSKVRGFNHLSKELFSFLSDAVIVAHNAMFEQRFLDFYMNYNQLPYTNNYFDTVKAMKLLFPNYKGGNRLDAFLELFGMVNENWHNANSDSLLTLIAFNKLRKMYLDHFGIDDPIDYDHFVDNDFDPEAWQVTSVNYWEKAYSTKNPKSRLYVRLVSPDKKSFANIFYDYVIDEWDYNNSLTRNPLDFSEITKEVLKQNNVKSLNELNPHKMTAVF